MIYNPNIIEPIPTSSQSKQKQEQKTSVTTITEINDIRLGQDFQGISFSNFKKADVKKKLLESLLAEKVEPACYWCSEFVCAGHYGEIWEIVLYYMSKHIHLASPNIAVYVELRYNVFRNIMNQGIFTSELESRNNEHLRKLFAEMMCVLALSKKKPSFEQMKIKSSEEFNFLHFSTKLKADNAGYIGNNFLPKDPKECFMAMNEFAYSLSEKGKNMSYACYWIEWTLEFETLCKKRKQHLKCELRDYRVENKFRQQLVWLMWDILLDYASRTRNEMVIKIMHSLKSLFVIKFTESTPKKRRYLMYYAVELLTEIVPSGIRILPDKGVLEKVTENIDLIYKQIKKNEHAPRTEYLFNGLDKKKAIEKSMKQMDMIKQMENHGS